MNIQTQTIASRMKCILKWMSKENLALASQHLIFEYKFRHIRPFHGASNGGRILTQF